MPSKRKEPINPVRVFFVILIELIEPEQNVGIPEDAQGWHLWE